MRGLILAMATILPAIYFQTNAFAEETMSPMGAQMFFDARKMGFTRDGKQQVFEGEFIAIGAGALIAADKVTLDREKSILDATGHIIVLSDSQVFTGDH